MRIEQGPPTQIVPNNQPVESKQIPPPLSPEQSNTIATLFKKGALKSFMEKLLNARIEGIPVPIEEFVKLNRNFSSREKDILLSENDEIATVKGIISRLRRKIEPLDLFIVYIHNDQPNRTTKTKEYFELKTKQELPQEEKEGAKLYTLRDLQSATDIEMNNLRSLVYSIRERTDLRIWYQTKGISSKKIIVMDGDTYELLVAMLTKKKESPVQSEKPKSWPETLGTSKEEPVQHDDGPFCNEHTERSKLGQNLEQKIEDFGIQSVDIILSHISKGYIKDLDDNVISKLLKNFLFSKLSPKLIEELNSKIGESPQQFFIEVFVKTLEELWSIDDIRTTEGIKSSVAKNCLILKHTGFNKENVIRIVLDHFSIPNPFTSSVVTNA